MGEKQVDDGKKKEKKSEAKEEKKGNEKAEKEGDGGYTLVMKMDLHCEGCASRVKRFIKKSDGVDGVKVDFSSNKLTVTGKMDGLKLKEGLESKTKKKVEIISPNPLPKKVEGEKKKPEEKKKEEPPVKVVVLKIRLHCDGCIHKIKRSIVKIKGVHSVDVQAGKDLVTVKGTMDVKTLPDYLKEKFTRGIEIVSQKEEPVGGSSGNKKGGGAEKPKESCGEKKESGDDKKDGGGEKKKDGEGKKKDGDGGGSEKKEKDSCGGEKKPVEVKEAAKVEANKIEYSGHGYVIEYVHAPQIFSDENPNACSIM